MYAGHLGPALAGKAVDPGPSLFAYVLASYAMDLVGVAHWLPGPVLLAGAVYLLARRRLTRRAAVVLAVVALSHVFLDAVTGVQLWPDAEFLETPLADSRWGVAAANAGVTVAGWAVYARRRPARGLVLAVLAVVLAVEAIDVALWEPPEDELDVDLGLAAALGAGLVVATYALVRLDRVIDQRTR